MKRIPRHYPLLQAQGNRCFYCDAPFSRRRRPTRDHVYPRCQGHNLMSNKVYACARCNQAKGTRQPTPEEVARAKALYASLFLTFYEPEQEAKHATG